jgi:hypothetical protein
MPTLQAPVEAPHAAVRAVAGAAAPAGTLLAGWLAVLIA